jgi:hypothetical protein
MTKNNLEEDMRLLNLSAGILEAWSLRLLTGTGGRRRQMIWFPLDEYKDKFLMAASTKQSEQLQRVSSLSSWRCWRYKVIWLCTSPRGKLVFDGKV